MNDETLDETTESDETTDAEATTDTLDDVPAIAAALDDALAAYTALVALASDGRLTPARWDFASVEEAALEVAQAIRQGTRTTLHGVLVTPLDQDPAIPPQKFMAITGNGPDSEGNARYIANAAVGITRILVPMKRLLLLARKIVSGEVAVGGDPVSVTPETAAAADFAISCVHQAADRAGIRRIPTPEVPKIAQDGANSLNIEVKRGEKSLKIAIWGGEVVAVDHMGEIRGLPGSYALHSVLDLFMARAPYDEGDEE